MQAHTTQTPCGLSWTIWEPPPPSFTVHKKVVYGCPQGPVIKTIYTILIPSRFVDFFTNWDLCIVMWTFDMPHSPVPCLNIVYERPLSIINLSPNNYNFKMIMGVLGEFFTVKAWHFWKLELLFLQKKFWNNFSHNNKSLIKHSIRIYIYLHTFWQ